MKTITELVRQEIGQDPVAFQALQQDILNLRAYARSIRQRIETQRQEKVDLATLAVALSRIQKEAQLTEPLIPAIKLRDLTIQTPLCELTYLKDDINAKDLDELAITLRQDSKDFVVITQGFREATIIIPSRHRTMALNSIVGKPVYSNDELCAITVHFSGEYLEVPNFIYSILSRLAAHRVNIVEIVSTSTELSLVVSQEAAETVNHALRIFLP